MLKKSIVALAAVIAMVSVQISACASDYSWADKEMEYCRDNMIMTGDEHGNLNPGGTLTRAEMAKMLVEGFDLEYDDSAYFADIDSSLWYDDYARAVKSCMTEPGADFNGDEQVTREEFAATLVRAAGLTARNIRNPKIIDDNFKDAGEVSDKYKTLLSVAVERAYFKGADGLLRPQDKLKRAEVCALLYRVIENKMGRLSLTYEDLGVVQTRTPIVGEPQISVQKAKEWAAGRGAADLFIDAADYYWQYGVLMGIRPEVLYVQAAKETGFGKYGGAVTADMNNFAGIKKYGASGDAKDDHESFATQEDGVRAHFNHMGAYVGIAPIGEPHGRYQSVKSLSWAGTVDCVEALGGKWCPDLYYGFAIVSGLLSDILK